MKLIRKTSTEMIPLSTKMIRVERIENTNQWEKYARARFLLSRALEEKNEEIEKITVSTTTEWMQSLDTNINEVYLFHSADPQFISAIQIHGFDEREIIDGKFGKGVTILFFLLFSPPSLG